MLKKDYSKAFKTILKKCVSADTDKNIVVIYDEFFLKFFPCFSETVNDLLYKVTYIFIPDSYQTVLQNNKEFYVDGEIQLPKGVNAAINQSDIVLNFLTGSTQSSKVRGSVLNFIKDNGCKVVHAPHLDEHVLDLIQLSAFERVHSDCELIAWTLGNTDSATIITNGPDGEQHELHIKLGGWTNDPFISSGIVEENSWGNVTPGEAFCCPKATNVNGSICINGSVSGYVFDKEDYLLLYFVKGKVADWKTKPNSKVHQYFTNLAHNANLLNDIEWNTFAELGIGLNPAIKKLTGNAIFDEKMAGTLHIAIGDNVSFGHAVQSHIHEDLIIKQPTLILDGEKIIDKGKLRKRILLNKRKTFNPANQELVTNVAVSFKQNKIHFDSGRIKRKLNRGNRVGYITVFDGCNDKIVALIDDIIKKDLGEISWDELVRRTKRTVDSKELNNILDILVHYKMAHIKTLS